METYHVYYQIDPPFFSFDGNPDINVDDVKDVENYRLVRTVFANNMEDVFTQMQGEIWSPNGEARELIKALGLNHTSMSVGDVIENNKGEFFQVVGVGFRKINP